MKNDVIVKLKNLIKYWFKPEKRNEYNAILLENATENDRNSLYKLYLMNYNRAVSDSSAEKAILYCQKAAELGLAEAQYDLGLHYLYGDIVKKDIFLAFDWIEKAADQDYIEAAKKLVSLYLGNNVVKRNEPRAEYWRDRASGLSKDELESVISLSPDMLDAPEQKEAVPKKEDKASKKEETKEPVEPKSIDELDAIGMAFYPVEQENVITAPASQSFIVNAGPGTGKTYTLIRRVNYLVEHGADASNIVVLSFTNAVVKEVLIRLNALAKEGGDRELRNTTVKTYHSLAWLLMKEANELTQNEEFEIDWEEKSLSFDKMNYEDGLIEAAKLVENNPDVVSGFECLIVDEIQDINNAKALFVTALVKACVKCRVPVLLMGDYCQAIYDYLNEPKNTANVNITAEKFYHDVMQLTDRVANFVCFEKNHRQNSELKELTKQFRKEVLAENVQNYRDTIFDMCDQITQFDSVDDVCVFIKDNPDKTICLMERANLETRLLSSKLRANGIDHYCVVGQDKDAYPGLIANIFSGYSEAGISKDIFESIIKNRGISIEKERIDDIWEKIVSETDGNPYSVDMLDLSRCLVKHGLDKALADTFERPNVCVSNVHKSKGLEYDIVIMDRSLTTGSVFNDTSEAKVLYVAMTRPKEKVALMDSKVSWGTYHKKNNRSYREFQKKRINSKKYILQYVEIKAQDDCGYPDVSPANFLFEDEVEMDMSQEVIREMVPGDPIELKYNNSTGLYDIHSISHDNMIIGCMPAYFTSSLKRIPYEQELPKVLTDLYIDGVYSFIGSPDGYVQNFEYSSIQYNNAYSKYRIWNYVKFSGPAAVKGNV